LVGTREYPSYQFTEASQILSPPQQVGLLSSDDSGPFPYIKSVPLANGHLVSSNRAQGNNSFFFANYRNLPGFGFATTGANTFHLGATTFYSEPAPQAHMGARLRIYNDVLSNYTGNVIYQSQGWGNANGVSGNVHMIAYHKFPSDPNYYLSFRMSSYGYNMGTGFITAESNTVANVYAVTPNSNTESSPIGKVFIRAVGNVISVATDASWIVQSSAFNANTVKAFDVAY
jgi:hypothetical protein